MEQTIGFGDKASNERIGDGAATELIWAGEEREAALGRMGLGHWAGGAPVDGFGWAGARAGRDWRRACGWIWLGGSSSRKGLGVAACSGGKGSEKDAPARAEILGCGGGALERRFWGAATARSSGISAAGRVWWQPEARARRQAAAVARRHGGGARRHGAEPSGIGVERSCGGSAGSAGWSGGGAKADAPQFPCCLLFGLG